MPKSSKTPVSVLNEFMDEYQLTAFSLAKSLGLSPSAGRLLTMGKSKITVSTALRLARFLGETPKYWLDLQQTADLEAASKDKDLAVALKTISKVQKPSAKAKAKADPKAKPAKKAAPKTREKK